MGSSLFDLEHRVGADMCARNSKDRQNTSIENYNLFPRFPTQAETLKPMHSINEFSSDNRLTFRDGYGVANAVTVDADSSLRNGSLITHDRYKTQLNARVFQAVPDLGHGGFVPSLESRLTQGESCSDHKSCNALAEVTINRFMPLVPCLRDTIQDPSHIVPPWTWGGEPTRDTVRQEEYLKRSGYVFDGTIWRRGCAPAHQA